MPDKEKLRVNSQSSLSDLRLSLELPNRFNDIEPLCQWKHIAALEEEAESARFDWLEAKDRPDAPALWRIFVQKATLLQRALESLLKSRNPFARDE